MIRLQQERQTLLRTLDNMPDEALIKPGAVGEWSAMDVLAYLAAWDGEALRRIAFAAGETHRPPHNVEDTAYWTAWSEKQIKLKQIMGPQGIKVDMAGTWVRLLARLEDLSPPDFSRWTQIDPDLRPERDRAYAEKLQAWRERWEQSLPWWQRWWRKISA